MVNNRRLQALVLFGSIWVGATTQLRGEEAQYSEASCTDAKCHAASTTEIQSSVHGLQRAQEKEIGCLSCHAPHGSSDPRSSNRPLIRGADVETCGACHRDQVETFYSTYHGKHFALGKRNVPTCVFCHAGHELPRRNARSPLLPENTSRMCAGCHAEGPRAEKAMATTLASPRTGRLLYRKMAFGQGLLKGIMGVATGGALVLGLIFLLQWLRNLRGEPDPATPPWPRWIWVHLALYLFFFVALDQTGITLLYAPEQGGIVGGAIRGIGKISMLALGTDDARSLIHRLAGIALALMVVVHLVSFALSPRLREAARLPANWFQTLMSEARRGLSPGDAPGPTKFILLYWTILVACTVMAVTGIVQWQAFSIMEFLGFGVVRYSDLVHEWDGRLLAMVTYGILLGYGVGLRAFLKLWRQRYAPSAAIWVVLPLTAAFVTLSACSRTDPEEISIPRASARPTAELPAMGSSLSPLGPGVSGQVFPSAETCKECHEREHREWKESFHSQSVNLKTFRAMYTIFNFGTEGKRPEYCFYCHAPESKILGKEYVTKLSEDVLAGAPVQTEGVTCTVCHMVTRVDPNDYSWFAPATFRTDSVPPYHAVFKTSVTQSSAVCSSCHDYNNLNIPHPEQPTTPCCTVFRGWETTEAAKEGITCQSCHMRDAMDLTPGKNFGARSLAALYDATGLQRYLDDRGNVSHLMPGGRNEEMLKKAVVLRFADVGHSENRLIVELELENKAAHSIPDG